MDGSYSSYIHYNLYKQKQINMENKNIEKELQEASNSVEEAKKMIEQAIKPTVGYQEDKKQVSEEELHGRKEESKEGELNLEILNKMRSDMHSKDKEENNILHQLRENSRGECHTMNIKDTYGIVINEYLLVINDKQKKPLLMLKETGEIVYKGKVIGNDKEILEAFREALNLPKIQEESNEVDYTAMGDDIQEVNKANQLKEEITEKFSSERLGEKIQEINKEREERKNKQEEEKAIFDAEPISVQIAMAERYGSDLGTSLKDSKEELKVIVLNKAIQTSKTETNLISDGYHTFGDLYTHRIELLLCVCSLLKQQYDDSKVLGESPVWMSEKHSDGEVEDGWFLLGIFTEAGEQITYHLPSIYWEEAKKVAKVIGRAPKFDGHTSNDVLERMRKL